MGGGGAKENKQIRDSGNYLWEQLFAPKSFCEISQKRHRNAAKKKASKKEREQRGKKHTRYR